MITMMWAMDTNKVIGNDNQLPWHYKDDMAYFKEHAYHKNVVLGYQTYLSMLSYFPSKKLPFDHVYIATRKKRNIENVIFIDDLDTFLKTTDLDLMIIGGAQIYEQAFPFADALRITYILKAYKGDTYFPQYNLKDFKIKTYETHQELILSYYERIKK